MKYKTFPFSLTIDDGFNEPKIFKMEFDGSVSADDLIKTLEEKFLPQNTQSTIKTKVDSE